jgi:hypothetical protein
LKLSLIALFSGLSLSRVHAQLDDPGAGLNSTTKFETIALQATLAQSVDFNTSDNDAVPVSHRAGDE